MIREIKKYYNEIKLFLFIVLNIILIINLFFVFTDFIAGKEFNYLAIIYSPVSNETWLVFFGTTLGALATFMLLFHYRQEVKYKSFLKRAEEHKDKLEEEKKILFKILVEFDDCDLYYRYAEKSNNKTIYLNELESLLYQKERILSILSLEMYFFTNFNVEPQEQNDRVELDNLKDEFLTPLNHLRIIYLLIIKNFLRILKDKGKEKFEMN